MRIPDATRSSARPQSPSKAPVAPHSRQSGTANPRPEPVGSQLTDPRSLNRSVTPPPAARPIHDASHQRLHQLRTVVPGLVGGDPMRRTSCGITAPSGGWPRCAELRVPRRLGQQAEPATLIAVTIDHPAVGLVMALPPPPGAQ